MIQSLFLLSPVGEVLIERHFRGVVTSRSVCRAFWDRASISINHHGGVSATSSLLMQHQAHYDTVPPVMEVPAESDQGTLYVISILRDGLSYLAVCPAEVNPLLILEFLHRIATIFVEYFGWPADESAIKDNFSTVYQLLEEMVDYGWPLTTEPNALKAMIRPPTVMSKLLQTTNTVSDELPSGTVSNMPWRASGVHYTQNEIYMDIVEEVDAIMDAAGNVVSADVSGTIQCQCHLSGIPDLLLTFQDPAVIDDCSFHPCVRYSRFEKDQIISFVPPDGNFELMRYRIQPSKARNFSPPIHCHAQWTFAPNTTTTTTTASPDGGNLTTSRTGRLMLQLSVASLSGLQWSSSRKQSGSALQVEDVSVTIPFPRDTRTTSDFQVIPATSTVQYDEAGKVGRWNVGKMDVHAKATLSCSFTLVVSNTEAVSSVVGTTGGRATSRNAAGTNTSRTINTTGRSTVLAATATTSTAAPPNLSITWKIPLSSVSGLTVSGLSLAGESYRPYKGVRNITKSGLFQVRCSS